MYYKLLKALGFAIYCEQYFYISKKDDTHFKVTAKSGFSAIVQIADNTMFVDILDDDKKNVAYYCTPFSNTLLTVENFVIKNIQENILFKFPRNIYCSELFRVARDLIVRKKAPETVH